MKNLLALLLFLIITLLQYPLFGQCEKDILLSKNNNSPVNYKKFNINNLSTFIYNDGQS